MIPFVIGRPDIAWWISGAFLVCFAFSRFLRLRIAVVTRDWPLLVASASWSAYGSWERKVTAEGANIRVDLLLLHPILSVLTVGSLFLWVASWIRSGGEP